MRLTPGLVVGFGLACVVATLAAPDAAALAAQLSDPSSRRRAEAARDLLDLGPAAAPALARAAEASDPEVRGRARALLTLVREGDGPGSSGRARAAASAVRDALRIPGGLDRGVAFDVLLAALAPEAGHALAAAALRIAEHNFISASMACALTRHATAESLSALAECVRDERMAPSAGLVAARELDRAVAQGGTRVGVLRGAAAASLSPLGTALGSSHEPTRRVAVALLGVLSGEESAARLEGVERDPDAAVRAELCRVLGLYAPASSARVLRALAGDPDPEVRCAALAALTHVPGTPRPEPAVAAAEDPSPTIRAAAARLLARDATPDSLPVLESLAADPSARVRAAARRALAVLQRTVR